MSVQLGDYARLRKLTLPSFAFKFPCRSCGRGITVVFRIALSCSVEVDLSINFLLVKTFAAKHQCAFATGQHFRR